MKKGFDKIYFLVFALLFSLLFLNTASATTVPCNPTINLVSQDPNPAIPDDYVKVLFEITNLNNCNGFSVKLDPQYPFSLDSDVNAMQTIAAVPYAPDSSNTWMIPYNVRIDKDAFDGDYSLKLQYQQGANANFQSSYAESGFNVSIKDSRIAFDAVIQEISGNSVSIAIANIGKYAANSVVVRIPTQDSFTATGTDGQMVGNLASGDYTLVGFTVSPKTNFAGNFTRGQGFRNVSMNQNGSQLKFDIYYTDNIGIRRIVNMQLPLRMGNSTAMGTSGAYGRSRTTAVSKPWYSSLTNWIIIIVLAVILYFLYDRYPEKVAKLKSFFHKGSSASKNKTSDGIPDWVKNSKEKKK